MREIPSHCIPRSHPPVVVIRKLIPPIPFQVRDELVKLVNHVFNQAQAGLWKPTRARTTPQKIESLVREQRLFVAQDFETQRIVGCVKVELLPGEDNDNHHVGQFGMLTVDPSMRGQGLGKKLIQIAEDWAKEQGCREMQLEIVEPRTWQHPICEFNRKLYAKLGYVPQRIEPCEEDASQLATDCVESIWRKPLLD